MIVFVAFVLSPIATCFADIRWAEAKVRLARENELLARRSQGHAGTYFVICTLYYTPMESGFTAQRGSMLHRWPRAVCAGSAIRANSWRP